MKQFNDSACGAACLEMIFRFHGIEDFSQEEFYERVKSQTPDGKNPEIKTDELVNEAKKRGFYSYLLKLALEDENQVMKILKRGNFPFIVCQQWPRNPNYGHFRVVVGIDEENKKVFYHDPHPNFVENKEMDLVDFIDCWRRTGDSVIGGVLMGISKYC